MKRDDYLFSRRRIKLNYNFLKLKERFARKKAKKHNKIFMFLILIFIVFSIGIIVFIRVSYPIFKSSCENAASSEGTLIINEEIRNVMKNYNYNSLVNIKKDEQENICFIGANTNLINDLVGDIINNIQKRLDKAKKTNVDINMGTVSGISVLNRFSPNFEIILETSGKIKSNIKSSFDSVAINQTYHRIYLNLEVRISILTPIETFYKDISQTVILTESIIVGDVPETYYNLEGVNSEEDTYNFIE